MQYTDAYSENIYTFANNINTQEGGTHLSGLRTALTRAINDYGRKYNFLKEKMQIFKEMMYGKDCQQYYPLS